MTSFLGASIVSHCLPVWYYFSYRYLHCWLLFASLVWCLSWVPPLLAAVCQSGMTSFLGASIVSHCLPVWYDFYHRCLHCWSLFASLVWLLSWVPPLLATVCQSDMTSTIDASIVGYCLPVWYDVFHWCLHCWLLFASLIILSWVPPLLVTVCQSGMMSLIDASIIGCCLPVWYDVSHWCLHCWLLFASLVWCLSWVPPLLVVVCQSGMMSLIGAYIVSHCLPVWYDFSHRCLHCWLLFASLIILSWVPPLLVTVCQSGMMSLIDASIAACCLPVWYDVSHWCLHCWSLFASLLWRLS